MGLEKEGRRVRNKKERKEERERERERKLKNRRTSIKNKRPQSGGEILTTFESRKCFFCSIRVYSIWADHKNIFKLNILN